MLNIDKPTKKLKRGDFDPENELYFWRYGSAYQNGESWVTKDKFLELREKDRLCAIRHRKTEKYKHTIGIYREINHETLKNNQREWYSKNYDKMLSYARNWAANNHERKLEVNKLSRIRRKDYIKKKRDDRRSVIKESINNGSNLLIINVFHKMRERLSNCLGMRFHVDHIIPLSKGGVHFPKNIQVLPCILNVRKSDKILSNPIWSSPEFSL